MPTSQLFLLYPINHASTKCVQDPENAHLVLSSPEDNRLAITVSLGHVSKTPGCIISFGRTGDIQISGSRISAIQCQFVLHESTREIIFRDCSSYHSSTLNNRSTTKVNRLDGIPRQVVIRVNDDLVLGMGGLHGDLYQFEIGWPMLEDEAYLNGEEDKRKYLIRPKNPRYAVTQDETETPASRYETRIQTPWSSERLLHRKLKQLGKGSFGTVYKTVEMHSGDHLAVKIIRLDTHQSSDVDWKKLVKREVEILHSVYHPHLAEFRHCQGLRKDEKKIEIFMTLYDNNLDDLLQNKPEFSTDLDLVGDLFRQILKALVYLAHKGIIHRDIKPANVLYTASPLGGYQWYLADFGLAKVEDHGVTRAGSGHFRAPEIVSGERQSHKADVYSLGMTMLFVTNSKGFRKRMQDARPLRGSVEFQNALKEAPKLESTLYEDRQRRWTAQKTFLEFFGEDIEVSSQPPRELNLEEPRGTSVFAEALEPQANIFGGFVQTSAKVARRPPTLQGGIRKARNKSHGNVDIQRRRFT